MQRYCNAADGGASANSCLSSRSSSMSLKSSTCIVRYEQQLQMLFLAHRFQLKCWGSVPLGRRGKSASQEPAYKFIWCAVHRADGKGTEDSVWLYSYAHVTQSLFILTFSCLYFLDIGTNSLQSLSERSVIYSIYFVVCSANSSYIICLVNTLRILLYHTC